MDLHIANPETGELLTRLSSLTGESAEQALTGALRERFERLLLDDKAAYKARIIAIINRVAEMPELDTRSDDEILGYNEWGGFD